MHTAGPWHAETRSTALKETVLKVLLSLPSPDHVPESFFVDSPVRQTKSPQHSQWEVAAPGGCTLPAPCVRMGLRLPHPWKPLWAEEQARWRQPELRTLGSHVGICVHWSHFPESNLGFRVCEDFVATQMGGAE